MTARLLVCILIAAALEVHGAADPYVPPELESWRQWVLEEHDNVLCPHAAPLGFACRWPEVLALEVDASGARFEQRWRMFAPGWIPLPGGARQWPVEVRVGGEAVPIGELETGPAVYLPAGEYALSGRFDWARPPERMRIPAAVGMVRMVRDGERIDHPQWQDDELWLGGREDATREDASLELYVHRLFADGEPQELTTHITLHVSGSAREERLGPALLAGYAPLKIDSELPVRVDEQGILHAQVRPGSWQVQLRARALAGLDETGPPEAQAPWPAQEIWSYRAADALRVTAVEGAAPVDPRQTDMPEAWKSLSAYRLSAGETLRIVEHSRGLDPRHGNRLSLDRNMWLRFDGAGWVVDDRISGAMVHDWRLEMVEPYRLTRLAEAGEPRMLSRLDDDSPAGAEVREAAVDVHAVSLVGTGAAPAGGWLQKLDEVNTTLHLPPGYRLFAASGFDRSSGDWLSRWGLMNIFGVIILAVAVARLYGLLWGALALAALVLTIHEPRAPLWLWLNAVLALALVAALSAGWLRRLTGIYAGLSLLLLLILLVPFTLEQARLAVFPQAPALAPPEFVIAGAQMREPLSRPAPEMEMDTGSAEADGDDALEHIQVTGSRVRPQDTVETYVPGALVQAGAATPAWQWQRAYLSLAGPVHPEQTARFWIIPPWLTGVWRIAGIVLVSLLLGRLMLRMARLFGRLPAKTRVAVAGVALLTLFSTAVTANTPDPEILAELESRLTRPPACTPHCVQIQRAEIDAGAGLLRLRLDVHAVDTAAVAVPGGRDGWMPEEVSFAGETGAWLLREDGRLWVPLPAAGRHTVILQGRMPDTDAFNLDFPVRPKQVAAAADGWEVSGLSEGKMLSDSLRFTRLDDGSELSGSGPSESWRERLQVPPFVIVERNIYFDLEWHTSTRIVRRAPADAGFTVSIPLLGGETVQDQDPRVSVAGGVATVTFPPGVNELQYSARLSRRVPLEISAGEADHYRERWNFVVSHVWHAAFDGLPLVGTVHDEAFRPGYFPRPGERLSIMVERPQAVPGETLSFERVHLATDIGRRARASTLTLDYRATQGGSHVIGLPADVLARGMRVDGRSVGANPVDGDMMVSITPGTHRIELDWEQTDGGLGMVTTARPELNAAAANIDLGIRLPDDRWVLWVSGSRMGPAVMYWFELVLIVVAALLLGRFRRLPVSRTQWVLLAIGLSLTAWPVMLVLFAWLFLLDWRAREAGQWGWLRFDLAQVGLFAASVITLLALLVAISIGLLSSPDMGIVGHGSSAARLSWFFDHSASGTLPAVRVLSLPMWCYKAVILLWSVWLSLALIGWLQWSWRRLSEGGIWRSRPTVETTKA